MLDAQLLGYLETCYQGFVLDPIVSWEKSKWRAYWKILPSRPVKISPTLEPLAFEEPSMCYAHWFSMHSFTVVLALAPTNSSFGMVHSVIKYARAWALIEGQGQNMRSNFMGSKAHFAIWLMMLSLQMAALNSWYVTITTIWAWK